MSEITPIKENPFMKTRQIRDHVKLTAPTVRPQINLDTLYDIVTGRYIQGIHGEMILNGGALNLTGVIGRGNTFKSTIVNCLLLQAMSRHPAMSISTYDSEGNATIARMKQLASRLPGLEERISYVRDDGQYTLISISEMQGEEWYNSFKDLAEERIKDGKSDMGTTPFIDKSTGKDKPLKTYYPSMTIVDSLSEFTTKRLSEKRDGSDVDASDQNNVDMVSNKIKTNMIRELLTILPRSGMQIFLTGHLVKEINMGGKPSEKDLTHGKFGYKSKGVPKNLEFLTHHYWEIVKAQILANSDKTEIKYPSAKTKAETKEVDIKNTDKATGMLKVTLNGTRNKTGLSGVPISYIVSQSEGVLFELSHFECLVDHEFGVTRQGNSFTVDLFPETKLQRTTVRDLVEDTPRLKRALELSAELCLWYLHHKDVPSGYLIKPKDLLDLLISQGIDINFLLDNTRGYWLYEEEIPYAIEGHKHYLSAYDLVRLAKGDYRPKWLP